MDAKYKTIQEKNNLFDSIAEIAFIKLCLHFFLFSYDSKHSSVLMFLKIELPKQ